MLTTIYVKGKKIEFCKYCKDDLELPTGNENMVMSEIAGCSMAHLRDIKARKTDWKTGEVYRIKNKTYFT